MTREGYRAQAYRRHYSARRRDVIVRNLVIAALMAATVFLLAMALAHAETGVASWYSGYRTANGERLNSRELTAAHKRLPFGTRVRVTARNGRSIVVRINDRGPFIRGRIIDLTFAGARALGMDGLAHVTLEVVR